MTLNRLKNLLKPYRGAGVLFTAADSSGTDRVLLGKRLYRPYADHWSIPGGQMDEQDLGDFRRCAAREIVEETIAINKAEHIQRLLGRHLDQAPMHRVHVPFFYDFRVFRVHLNQMPDIRLWPRLDHWSSEFSEFGWFTQHDLPLPLHPFLASTINTFLETKK